VKPVAFILTGSIAANLVCAIALVQRPALAPPAVRQVLHLRNRTAEAQLAAEVRQRTEAAAQLRAAQAAASQTSLWATLDSDDLKKLVARLRAAGFPPKQIRAIVSARIEARFTARRQEIAGTVTGTPYWKAEPAGFNRNSKSEEQWSQLFRERAQAMRELLGDESIADSAAEATARQRREFGDLPKAKVDLIQRIKADYDEIASQIRATMQGITLPEDREKLALLEREKRADLAAILTAEELREYEMRSSTIATRLSPALGVMDATMAEYRAIYAVLEPLANRLYPIGGVKGSEMARQRTEAEKQTAEQLVAVLGPARTADYTRATDPAYQQLYRLAQRESLPLASAVTAFEVRSNAALESRRIDSDRNLDADAKLAAKQTLADTTQAGLLSALGPVAGTDYVKSAQWLTHIRNGGNITFGRDGSIMFSSPPPAKPAIPGK